MAAAASAASGAAGAAPRSRGSSLAARQQADYMNPNCACTLGPLPAEAKNAANALSDERPTRLSENLRICYPHLTAKSDQYGSRTTAETQLVQVKEGVKDPQVVGAFSGIFNLLDRFDTGMIADKSLIPSIKKYRRLRVAGILQAMLLGEVELSDQSVYTAAITICEAMPREPELHCEPTRNALIEMTLSTAVSPSLVPRGGNWLYEMAKVESRWQTFFQAANKNVIRAMQAAVEKGRRDMPSNVQPAGAEEAFKAWAYQRPTALCTPPKAVVGYMKAIYCISADALSEPAKPSQTEPSLKRGGSVPDVAGGDNPQPEDSTPSLSTDASMGMASHPEASRPAGRNTQPAPADAGGAKGASPSQGAVGGAEGDSPTSPADELPGRDDPMDGSGTGGGGGPNPPDGDDDPSEPGDHESGPESEYYAPADPPALAAWRNGAWPRRLLYPNQADSIEDALALTLWQGLSEDEFFELLDNASATDRRFGEYDWDFLSKAILSDTMNADDIHHAGAKALAEWAEDNLGPLSFGPRSDLVTRFNQMQTEREHPSREAANESVMCRPRETICSPSSAGGSAEFEPDLRRRIPRSGDPFGAHSARLPKRR